MTQDSSPAPTFTLPPRGPLILGAGGAIGTALRHLWQAGQWPDAAVPLWQSRSILDHHESVQADLDPAGLARLAVTARGVRTHGIIVLAGATAGDAETLAINTRAAQAAVILRALGVAGPVLCLSSAAVYGAGDAPLTEDSPLDPRSPYAQAKVAMEEAMAPHDGVTCLRLCNVAGSDGLLGAMGRDIVRLDRLGAGETPDRAGETGTGPLRSYIGPLTLARALVALCKAPALPKILNLAQPAPQRMEALLTAAGAAWEWQEAPATALPALTLDTAALDRLVALPAAEAATLLAEAEAAGWRNPQAAARR